MRFLGVTRTGKVEPKRWGYGGWGILRGMTLNLTPHTDSIIETFRKILPDDPNEWQLLGVINKDKDVYTFGSDSKIIGRAFEIVATQYIKELAEQLGYTFHESKSQTVYPDFYLEKPNGKRIAIDIKSTYRRSESSNFCFTLGSFTGYLRNGTKNIDGHYDDYDSHYVLGFVYSRTKDFETKRVTIKELDTLTSPYEKVEIIFMEKYRIGGDKKGSGNTDNISTISANHPDAFNNGYSPFTFLGKDVFEHYWRNYPRYTMPKQEKEKLYTDLPSYFSWLERQEEPEFSASELRKKYRDYQDAIADEEYSIKIKRLLQSETLEESE